MGRTISSCKRECELLRKSNPAKKFRVHFCEHAKEWTVQVEDKEYGWFCLHNTPK